MGYLLPIQPIQSQLYAKRLEKVQNHYSYVDSVQPLELNAAKSQPFRERYRPMGKIEVCGNGSSHITAEFIPFRRFEARNLANLTQDIAHLIGKGHYIDVYV